LLIWHPLAFLVAGILWMAVVATAVMYLPEKPARLTAMLLTLSHSIGVASWCVGLREPAWAG
jgi:hypothetical protein